MDAHHFFSHLWAKAAFYNKINVILLPEIALDGSQGVSQGWVLS